MPELPEVEMARNLVAGLAGRVIERVVAPDAFVLKRGLSPRGLARALRGRTVTGARRRGKLLLVDTDGPVLGLHFGMSGRLVLDGRASVADLVWSSNRDLARWDRLVLGLSGGSELRLRDPRRLAAVELDPPEHRLGPDALDVTEAQLAAALRGSAAPLKARLLDQSRLAGVGNLIADEVLWRAGLDPARPAGSLGPAEVRRLHRHLRATLADLLDRGGSHTGDLMAARRPGGTCPRDGTPLRRRTVGGRTTWSCPLHQR
jgi:formamidopyrimidine-DNA glycosylase